MKLKYLLLSGKKYHLYMNFSSLLSCFISLPININDFSFFPLSKSVVISNMADLWDSSFSPSFLTFSPYMPFKYRLCTKCLCVMKAAQGMSSY